MRWCTSTLVGDKVREVLVVSPWLRGDPQFWFTIQDVIIYFMQWRDFSETRWGDVGHSGRLWIRSVYVGVEALVDFALASTEIHNKHLLGGYRGLDYECRNLLAIVCFNIVLWDISCRELHCQSA